MHQTINKTYESQKLTKSKLSILSTLNKGFNSFYDINFPSNKKSNILFKNKRIKTLSHDRDYTNYTNNTNNTQINISQSTFQQSCPLLAQTLRQNKFKLNKVKTQVDSLRNIEFSDYIKKSLRYQELLNLNQNKKKHLPTLNAKIGQIVKKSAVQAQTKNITYQIKYQKINLQGWKPQSRQGHTCIIYKSSAFIIGGHCSNPFSAVQVYSIDRNQWYKQIATPNARSYHSSLLYKNRFIITFGGMGLYDVSRKCRGCYNTVSLIDLSNYTNRQMKMHNQDTIQARRSHSAVLMSKNMLIFGGMNAKKQFLSDLVYLDLKQLRWYHKQFKIQGKQLAQQMQTGIAKHKAIAIFKQRKHLPFYMAQYGQHQGIYVFGGGFGDGQQNTLLQLSFNKYVPVLRRVDYSGIAPSNIDPVLQRYNDMILIISGDQKQRQIRLFKPMIRQFVVISNSYSRLLGGIGSSITCYENDYYVFFGLGEDGYIGTISSFVIEQKVRQRQKMLNKKKLNNNNNNKYSNMQMIQWKNNNNNMNNNNNWINNDSSDDQNNNVF